MSKLETYGLSSIELQATKEKVAKQKDYMQSHTFISNHGEERTFLDVSFSPNLSERYYARILNKVDTFVSTSISRNLVPVFLTVTADGFFRRFMKADYHEWTEELKEKYKKHIPNNERHGMYFDYIDKKTHELTPKDIYKIMAHQIHRFYMCKTLRSIKKNDLSYTSIRVTEPHKDGVPHFHILMYIPEEYKARLYVEFQRFFPAPQNHKVLTKKNTKGKNKRDGELVGTIIKKGETINLYETQGFQTKIRSASGYILKYILKSFTNLINNEDIDYMQAWYIQNRIPRIITTHTLLSQDEYQKCAMMDDDWHHLTEVKQYGDYERDRDNNYFKLTDSNNRTIMFDNGLYMLTNRGRIIYKYGEKKNIIPTIRLRSLNFTRYGNIKPANFKILRQYNIYTPHKEYKYTIITNYKDGTCFSFSDIYNFSINTRYEIGVSFSNDGDFQGFTDVSTYETFIIDQLKPISKYSDLELHSHYISFDFDEFSQYRYVTVHNEMIDRGLIQVDYIKYSDMDYDFTEEEIHHE